MNNKKLFQLIVHGLALVVILAGCSSSHQSPSMPLSTPTVIATQGVKEWNYVALGDSTQFRFINLYAAILEKDLGVKLNIQDRTLGGQSSGFMLDELRNNAVLRRDIQNADVITFIIPLKAFEKPGMKLVYGNPADCGGADHQDCLRSALQAYKADTEAIFAEIVSLRSPSEALIRTMDMWLYHVNDMKKAGVFEIFNQYWQSANEYVIQTASEYGIPVARVYADFMGPNGDEDPTDKGLLSDGLHPTEEGGNLIAKIVRDLGYDYAPKP